MCGVNYFDLIDLFFDHINHYGNRLCQKRIFNICKQIFFDYLCDLINLKPI